MNYLKAIDKFLKFLKTDRNTFVAYILALISAYIMIDRIVEILFIIFTGVSYSYWGPIEYTLSFACIAFAFFISFGSKFAKNDRDKIRIFHIFCISLYIVAISACVQWLNQALWLGLLTLPNFPGLVSEFHNLFFPALTALGIYFPLTTFYKLFKWLTFTVDDSKDTVDSICDYGGISLATTSKDHGVYSCDMKVCTDSETGENVKIPEIKRFESLLAVGVSGSGKTSMIYEPMLAIDINKKFFFKEVSKELGFTALKTRIATLDCPYDNEYINKNFSLSMLIPNPDKLDVYKKYMSKMILSSSGENIIYRDLGLTYVSAEPESTSKIIKIVQNYNLPVNIVDPGSNDSIGINPFIYKDPIKTGIAISSVLKGLFAYHRPDLQMAFRENAAIQIIENLSILLKEIYPRKNNGALPTLEDMLNLLNDFSLVQQMTEEMKQIPELAEKYRILIKYLESNFYENGIDITSTKQSVFTASTELDNLLRYPGVKNVLCNRNNNIDFDKALSEGQITIVCTRRGDLGATAHKAFGLFFLLLMQQSVLARPGNDSTRIPHFLYIDDFPDFVCKAIEPVYTLYRKYKVATVLDAQNLSQLEGSMGDSGAKKMKETILANCVNKVIFGNALPEDLDWWQKEMQDKREWTWSSTMDGSKNEYDPKMSGIKYAWIPNYSAGKIKSLKGKQIIYKVKATNGKSSVGKGNLDFIDPKYKAPKNIKKYDFLKYTSGISDAEKAKQLFEKARGNFEDVTKLNDVYTTDEEFDPIQTNTKNSSFLFNNDEAIVVNFKKKNKNNEE